MTNSEKTSPDIIVFFDGVCGLCNHFVDWLMAHDLDRVLRYAPLQGETARQLVFEGQTPTRLNSIMVWRFGRVLKKSDAVLVCLSELGGGWRFVRWLRFVPRFLRDGIYDLVAVNRYQLFGRRDVCRLPTPEERDLFLS